MERFLDYFKPCRYQLEECIFRQEETFKGKVKITGELRDSRVIKLHAVNLDIQRISWQPYWRGYETESSNYGSAECNFHYDGEVIEITVTDEMYDIIQKCSEDPVDYPIDSSSPDQDIDLEIVFSSKLSRNMEGCYLSTYEWNHQVQKLVATQFESHYARNAFPCIDEPAAKAIFDLTIIVPDYDPSCDVVLANMPSITHVNGRFEFASTPRMSTYLLAWVVGPLQSVSTVNKNGVRVSSYCALNQPLESLLFANDTAARALEYYDEKFGTKYPLPKLDQVALPDFESGAMENWGLVTYRESMMLANRDASVDVKRTVATTVTHELSHQWFGDLVTMQWWDDLWLNESFATVIEYFAADALYPELKVWQDFFTSDCLAALKRDALPGVQAMKQEVHSPAEIATLFDAAIVYAKGARLVLMLMRLMGEDNFYQGMRYYFEKYAYKNTIGDDLWAALQSYAEFDVKRFMDAWISQSGYPALQEAHNGDQTWWEQQRFLINGTTDGSKWPLPEVKDDMSGHYLLDLGDEEFKKKLDNFSQLSTEQKLRLLIDRMLLAKAGHASSASLLDLIPKFQTEDSAAVLDVVASILDDLKLFCPPESEAAGNYKKFLHNIYSARFAEIDFAPISDADRACARDILLSIARYSEDEKTTDELLKLYRDDFASIDSELLGRVLGAKLKNDETEVFAPWLTKYQTEADPYIKRALLAALTTCAEQDEHLNELLSLLDRTDVMRPQDHIFLYIYLLRNYRTRERTIKWLTEHWDFVVQLTGDKSVEDYARYAANPIRTPAEAQTFYSFFDQKSDDPILSRTLKIAHVEIDARLRLIETNRAEVEAKLKELTKGT